MPTILFASPVFGPVQSRRLGLSLGINLLPADGKVCSFDCIYCECGFNKDFRTKSKLPSRSHVRTTLEHKLKEMRSSGLAPDVLTFAGNGEPTLHPHFAEIIDDTLALRDRYAPDAKVSVLSNAAHIGRPAVFEALNRVDNSILKLDTANEAYLRRLNRPTAAYSLPDVIGRLKAFGGNCILQTLFLNGTHAGQDVGNTSAAYVLPWIETVKEIAPRQVMIYTLDRETPGHNLQKATPEELDRIVSLLAREGIHATASY